MAATRPKLRVLIIDDNRDGADALGLLVEAFCNQAHVTYGGSQALDVAMAFRPDLMLIDLAMPDLDGCHLVTHFRQRPAFTRTKIVAITDHANEGHRTLAKKAGFDAVLAKPVAFKDIEGVLDGVKVVTSRQPPKPRSGIPGTHSRLPIGEARRIRNERESKTLT